MRYFLGINRQRFLPQMRFPQIFALQRARDRHLTLSAAADGTDIHVERRTSAARAALAARLHNIGSDIHYGYYRINGMKRVDLYIKVEVEIDEDETPDRVAKRFAGRLRKFTLCAKPNFQVRCRANKTKARFPNH